MLCARKYRFGLCFRVLSNQYVERSAFANVFKFNRGNKRFEGAIVNSRCFHWFRIAMLESLRRAPTWHLHTKPYNFQWNLLPNNSSSEYHTSPNLWHVVYLLLFYDISISWLNLFNGKIIKLTCVAWKPAGEWSTNSSSVLPTSQVVYQPINHRNLRSIAFIRSPFYIIIQKAHDFSMSLPAQ